MSSGGRYTTLGSANCRSDESSLCNIGIKHDFYSIVIWYYNRSLKGEGFNSSKEPSRFNASEKDNYSCIKRFGLKHIGEKASKS